jgi:undecaprenyl-diphosphatase
MRFLANYCPSSSSFTSSHACNHFAMAFFIYRTLRQTSPWWSLVFVWAFMISYAQVYVGVHYPLDVICGAVVGSLIGLTTSRLFRLQAGTLTLQPLNPSHA